MDDLRTDADGCPIVDWVAFDKVGLNDEPTLCLSINIGGDTNHLFVDEGFIAVFCKLLVDLLSNQSPSNEYQIEPHIKTLTLYPILPSDFIIEGGGLSYSEDGLIHVTFYEHSTGRIAKWAASRTQMLDLIHSLPPL